MSIEKNYMAKVAMNKSVLKEYCYGSDSRVVYLNDGDEFQICLFNPETFTVGAKICINGELGDDGLIVLRPGERVWVERPLNKQRKYKFETYEVEDSAEVENAIRHNGLIEVYFYKESRSVYNDDLTYSTRSAKTFNNDGGSLIDRSFIDTYCESTLTCLNSASNATFGLSSTTSYCSAEPATMETGRISTGSNSKQNFHNVNIEFSYFSYKSESIKLMPMSRKPYTASDLQKVYCTNCGRKLNPNFKFCPYCGEKCILLDY